MYLPSLAGLSLTGPSHCRPCATDKVVEYEDEEALRDEGAKYIAEFSDEPGEPAKPGCAICQLPFEPGRDGGNDNFLLWPRLSPGLHGQMETNKGQKICLSSVRCATNLPPTPK